MALESVANEVVNRVKETEEIAQGLDVPSNMTRYDDKLDQLIEQIERLEMVNRQLIEKLNEQQRYINQRLEERDRKLMESIRAIFKMHFQYLLSHSALDRTKIAT
ncbi:hypothetical protein GT2_32_00300 [Parageobacillus thermoglucosidasius NBRC 107763]|jgi:Holliday junction resolvasome RuvABC ATP-dependent DNA helicase subunit|uniref:hypothetical protein n=1 Tax=Parageobacillus TaxID=1906945 RepID=UPI000442FDCC|nr:MULTISPECIES: hypothetical protein [Parageobacillus]WMT20829.1 hypothetical protein RFB12_18045 [Parageobacillus toebii]GAJ45301.1 hypothetical protein GT2_32_00300 [Parageobacillus thermoglucosidasius NBRC 107763]